MADVKEIVVQWDAGQGISAIARSLGYTRPTVRKYVEAAQRAGLARGAKRRREVGWHELAQTVVDRWRPSARRVQPRPRWRASIPI